MFDFGNSNDGQRQAITTVDGPVLITAGPGTGKTYTLVQRAIYLIEERKIQPENIFIATFTEKAAKEIITRITNELDSRNISANINEMYIGTFHSLCLRILKENLEYTRLKKNYRVLDAFDQQYMIFQNIYRFQNIPNIMQILPQGSWNQAETICNYVNNLSEELVDPNKLINDSDPEIAAVGNMLLVYENLLSENNFMDFSAIQIETFRLLQNNQDILEKIRTQITHIMIDEYQDTNYIQEQLVFLLGGNQRNICVVGDDDQGLYRFRGATIRNILEFPQKFAPGECRIIALDINYRSNSDIVDFYNTWMSTTAGQRFSFSWGKFRYDKHIRPHKKSTLNSPAVIRIDSENDEDEWKQKILAFITKLRESGKLTDYNQIAFLFRSVKNQKAVSLAKFLEKNHINVYSPRSDMFFEREEIRIALGCLMLLFPEYVQKLEKREFQFLRPNHYDYYYECIRTASSYLLKPEYSDLKKWIRNRGLVHHSLTKSTDYGYAGLLYQLFEYEPFVGFLDVDIDSGVVDVRPARNLAKLSQLIGKFEHLYGINVIDGQKYKGERRIDTNTEKLFNLYLKLLVDGGISEYEDDSEYAPSGCVSFLTIHQSKGMEFPIVILDSLSGTPVNNVNGIIAKIERKYFNRPAFEPYDQIKYFDFWRLYYTAYSRAQNLLVLTCNKTTRTPSLYFRDFYNTISSDNAPEFDVGEFDFADIKDVNLKETFSFTSHITVYETCSRQYKFYKELEFAPVRAGAMLFGLLVHETIEDVHKAAIRHEEKTITTDNVEKWFDSNYASLSQSEHAYLAAPQLDAALRQVQRYVDRKNGDWSDIKQAEVDVSLVKPDYIVEGKIDLIKGKDDTVEIVDFKSEKKPDVNDHEHLERYRRQLNIYAHLVEQRTGQKVSKMHLYYTGEENGVPTITFPYTKTAVEGTMSAFDDIVHRILRRDFTKCAENTKICENCDFRFYCKNK